MGFQEALKNEGIHETTGFVLFHRVARDPSSVGRPLWPLLLTGTGNEFKCLNTRSQQMKELWAGLDTLYNAREYDNRGWCKRGSGARPRGGPPPPCSACNCGLVSLTPRLARRRL